VSRPSPAAAHSTSTTRSLSASEALTPGDAPGPKGSPVGEKPADTLRLRSRLRITRQ
jgi:hypothetical protein